jgi:hypothetical protein
MRKFNIVACIIVLLLAVISGVFSFFLYQKRTQFVDGWSQMANTIHDSAKEIDTVGEIKFASRLTTEVLSHEKYEKETFARSVGELLNQSKAFVKQYQDLTEKYNDMVALQAKTQAELDKVIGQRKNMASAFVAIGKKLGMNVGSEAQFNDPATYAAQVNGVRNMIFRMVDARNNMISELNAIIAADKKTIDARALAAGNVKGALAPLRTVLNTHKSARNNYAHSLKMIAGTLKVNFSDNGSPATTVTDGVRKAVSTIASLEQQLGNARRDIASLKTTIGKRDAEISRLNGLISDYKRVLDIDPTAADPVIWKRGSAEARSAVVGTVVEVSEEFGYIVINIGTETTVVQKVGNKTHTLNVDLENGLNFNVVRDEKFIAAITLNNVSSKESTANIPVDKVGQIKVGDQVVFKK